MLNSLEDFEYYLARTLEPYRAEVGMKNQRVPKTIDLRHNVLMVSPHPDDECINGALALRLKQEASCTVFNFPFTLGSKLERTDERKKELETATELLGFINIWNTTLSEAISKVSPRLIVCPHEGDGHPTHITTAKATLEAIKKTDYSGLLATCEFWHPDNSPNLLLEVSLQDCAKLMHALRFHEGEIKRNPYHLRLPFWMMDNSRRGSEIILGNTLASHEILLSTIYRVSLYQHGQRVSDREKLYVSTEDNVGLLFQ